MKTAEQIYQECERATDTVRAETIAINKAYRAQYKNDSDINKAIRNARIEFNRCEMVCCGLEYCLEIENQLSKIVNKDY